MPEVLSLTGKRWTLKEGAPVIDDKTHPQKFITALFKERGIHPTKEEELLSPHVFKDMEKAVDRIRRAIHSGETIGIFGDYDCDGVTATVQIIRFFRRQGIDPLIRLPNRVHDGYGLKGHIVEEFISKGTNLLVTVDSGIGSVREIKRAKDAGMDVIITDHHHVSKRIPPAYTIVHPALSPDYPKPYPSGSAVSYHLIRALEDGDWEDMHHDLALAMLGVIADVMELKGQNRVLVKEGLKALKQLTNEPLADLITQAGLNKEFVTSTDIAFRIAPRINAAGRMADPLLALQALLNGGEALITLNGLNELRQHQTEKLLEEALKELETQEDGPLLAVVKDHFPEGIVGLLAGKLTEKFGKPSLIGRTRNGMCTASLRSVPAYNVTEGLERCSDLLQYYGGHAQAAGCSFHRDAFEELSKRLNEDIKAHTDADDLLPTLTIDAVLSSSAITLKLCEELKRLEPFGQGNREPLFLLENVKLDYTRCVGNESNHLQGNIAGTKAVGFRLGHLLEQTAQPLDLICKIGVDSWNGKMRPQVFVEDMRVPTRKAISMLAN